jgi:hypothetical protein
VIDNDSAKDPSCVVTFNANPGQVTAASLKVLATGVNVEEITATGTVGLNGLNIVARNVSGRNFFIGGKGVSLIGGNYGNFDGCQIAQDGGRVWLGATNVLVQDVKIENVRREGCSDHVDGIQIWGANHVTFRNMNLVAPMPTLTVIARPGMAGGKAYPLTDIRFEGGHYGKAVYGFYTFNICSGTDKAQNIVLDGVDAAEQGNIFRCAALTQNPAVNIKNSTIKAAACGGSANLWQNNTYVGGVNCD